MSNGEELRPDTTPVKTRRSCRTRRVLRDLAIMLSIALLILSVFLYNPVRTLATLGKVDGFPLYVMHYEGTYLFDSFAEAGLDDPFFRRMYEAVNPEGCTSLAAPTSDGDVVFGHNLDWSHRSLLLLFTQVD